MHTPRSFALLAALAMASACSESRAGADASTGALPGEGVELPDGGIFTRVGMLGEVGACVMRSQEAFLEDARSLEDAVAGAGASGEALERAREAWRGAMTRWQHLELMQIGPLAVSTMPGGDDVRDQIYAWPFFNPCLIDQTLVSMEYADVGDLYVSARGLSALEYLLFYDGPENACAATDPINTAGSWEALDDETLRGRRLDYALALARDITTRAADLVEEWRPDGGNFQAELTSPDTGRIYGSARLALNSVSDALFYLEYATKDAKVAGPLGLRGGCDDATCDELLESRYAHRSLEHIRENIHAFRLLYEGCGDDYVGLGFDDLLYARGATQLAADLRAATLGALAATDAFDSPTLHAALTAEPAKVQALYDALKAVSDLLRTQFISILDLELPTRVEGDND